jgi:hypothetical protein
MIAAVTRREYIFETHYSAKPVDFDMLSHGDRKARFLDPFRRDDAGRK